MNQDPVGSQPKLNKSSIQSLLKDLVPSLEGHTRHQKIVWFDQPTGLGLRIVGTKTGHGLAWVVQTRPKGASRPCRLTLKTPFVCSQESIDTAREEAFFLIEQARRGLNPAQERTKTLLLVQAEDEKAKVIQEAETKALLTFLLSIRAL